MEHTSLKFGGPKIDFPVKNTVLRGDQVRLRVWTRINVSQATHIAFLYLVNRDEFVWSAQATSGDWKTIGDIYV